MDFLKLPIVRFSICVALGIFFSRFYNLGTQIFYWLPLALFILALIYFLSRKQLIQSPFFALLTYVTFFLVGFADFQLQLPAFQIKNYVHFISEDKPSQLLQLKITENLKPDLYNEKFLAEVISVENQDTKGKILLNLEKDTIGKNLVADDILLVSGKVLRIEKPSNPDQFDYGEYLKMLGASTQLKIGQQDIIKLKKGKPSLRGFALNIRRNIISKLEKSKLKTDERAIVQALVLGERRDINNQMYKDYAAAGAIHILAVSGLHVGILFFILKFLFRPFRYSRYGKVFSAIAIILLLYGYALIAGFSPSVVRASTMFSLFIVADRLIKRPTNSFNTLFLSFLGLLLFNPMWLFHVGFQLSYAAVFSILLLQPKLSELYRPKNRFIKYYWNIITVSIAAQLGVLPLSLYYFHQFPGLFLFTNIIVLTFLVPIFCIGILVILFTIVNILPDWLVTIYNGIISWLNRFIRFVSRQQDFIFEEIHFSMLSVISCYLLIFSLSFLLKKIDFNKMVFFFGSVSVVIGFIILDKKNIENNELVIFQKSRATLIGIKQNDTLMVLRDSSESNIKDATFIKNYRIANSIKAYSEETIPDFFKYKKKSFLILDSLGIYPKLSNIDFVLLRNSPKVNLERLIDSLKPKTIIADGSNYKTYAGRWQKTCEKRKVPFHSTYINGAFVIK